MRLCAGGAARFARAWASVHAAARSWPIATATYVPLSSLDPKPGPAAAARAAAATAKAAAQQREAPPPKAKAGDPAAGGTLTEKEGRSTGAPRARAPPPLTALEGPRQVPGAWRRAHAGSFSPVHLGSSFPAAQAAAGHGTRPDFALRERQNPVVAQ